MEPEAYLEMAETETSHWWFTGRRVILQQLLHSLQLPERPKILEIGCGTGGNLDLLSQFGHTSGMEFNETARRIALKKTNNRYTIKAGQCPDTIPFAKQSFDVICLFDVLEHIRDDKGTLIAISKLLKKNGTILVTVPAYQWLWGPHDDVVHHKRRYSRPMLRQTIRDAGLSTIKISYFNTILFPLAVLFRLKDKLSARQTATGTQIPPAPINTILKLIFTSERFLLKHFSLPFGLSLFCIAHKSEDN